MIKNKFNSEISTEITELSEVDKADIKTIEGLSSFKKFILIALPKYRDQYPTMIFQNTTDKEKEQLFDMLDKELHQETYTDLENQLDRVHFENERLKEELAEVESFIWKMPLAEGNSKN